MNAYRSIVRTTGCVVFLGLGFAAIPVAHADAQQAIANDYIQRLQDSSMSLPSAKQRELAMVSGIAACQLDAMGGAQPAGSERFLAAAKASGWCNLAAANATGLSAASAALSQASFGSASNAASGSNGCPAGFYPTDTSGVCVDTPPAARPAHVPTAELPGPIFDIVEGGNQSAVEANFDSDHDGFNDAIDAAPTDPDWH
jgi:hypothetical protein